MANGYKKSIVLGLDISDFEKNAKKAEEEIKEVGSSAKSAGRDMESSGQSAKAFGNSLTAVVDVASLAEISFASVAEVAQMVAAAMKECIDVAAEYVSEINEVANQHGWTAESAQEWEYLAAISGTSLDTISDAFTNLEQKMYDANHGNKEARQAFNELGIAITDSQGKLKSSEDVFSDVVDRLNELSDSTKRSAQGTAVFGAEFSNMAGIMSMGKDEIEQTKASMDGFLSDDEVQAMTEYSKAIDTLQENFKILKAILGADLVGAITPFIDVLNELDPRLIAEGLESMAGIMKYIGNEAVVMAMPLMSLLEIFQSLGEAIESLKDELSTLSFSSVGNAMKWLVTGNDKYVGHNANGTQSWRGGLTWVGEQGPELVNVPTGSQIFNNNESNNIAGNTTYNISMNCDMSRIRSVSDVVDAINGLNNSRRGI